MKGIMKKGKYKKKLKNVNSFMGKPIKTKKLL